MHCARQTALRALSPYSQTAEVKKFVLFLFLQFHDLRLCDSCGEATDLELYEDGTYLILPTQFEALFAVRCLVCC